jgi:hypothetical protein
MRDPGVMPDIEHGILDDPSHRREITIIEEMKWLS